MDKIDNIQSGADYAKLLIDEIISEEDKLFGNEKLPLPLLNYWCEEIELYADKTWQDYILGKRDSFLFDEAEMEELYNKAGIRYTGDILDGLLDKEMIQMSIREDGEILYSTTEKGKQAIKDNENLKLN